MPEFGADEAAEAGISLVIPAYNEQDRLHLALDQYLPVLRETGSRFEVIVVADGSDNTPEVASRYASQGVTCLSYRSKLGRGGAILEGFRKARFQTVAYADADGSVPASDLHSMITLACAGTEAVIASRRIDPASVAIPERSFRRAVGLVWSMMVRVLLGLEVHDAQCGLKVFSGAVVRSVILPRLNVTNRTFEVLMLYHVAEAGYRIVEVPVAYAHNFDTRMPIGRAVPVMLLTLLGAFLTNRLSLGRHGAPEFFQQLNARWATV